MAGSELLSDEHAAVLAAQRLATRHAQATAGGGYRMRICEMRRRCARLSPPSCICGSNFANGGVYLERFVRRARHIEVQIFGDGAGRWWHWASVTAPCSVATRR